MRLTAISNPPSAFSYFYDGAGNRLKAIRDTSTTKYIYGAGGNLLAEADASNNITKYYIYGAGLLAMVNASDNQVYTYHFNQVGSTVAMTDQSKNVVNKYSYDEFGSVLNQVEAVPQPFKFVGQFGVMTEPNGFYYMRARYYDPKVGRFISEDPIGFAGGDVNLMAYVGNNPLLLIDPLGLQWLRMAGDPAVMGSKSKNVPESLQPDAKWMMVFEFNVPNFYETSKQYDALLGALGIDNPYKDLPTAVVTIVTMPITFGTALITNIFETITGTEKTIFGNGTNSPSYGNANLSSTK